MKSINRLAIFLIPFILILGGCDNKNLAIWSPDGTKLGIIAADGFRISSATGELSPPLIKKAIALFAWFSDSKKIVLQSEESITSWSDLKTKLAADEIQAMIEAGPKVMAAIRSLGPESDKIWTGCPGFDTLSKQCAEWVYLKQEYRDELKTILKEKWKDFEGVGVGVESIEIYELEPTVKQIKTLYYTLNDIAELRVSPNDKQIAIVEDPFAGPIDNRSEKAHKLMVVSAEGDNLNIISTHSSDYPDWSPDGKQLVYCEEATEDEPSLGTIKQLSTSDSSVQKNIHSRDLAYLCFSYNVRIRCLKNSTILFSTAEMHLPATPIDYKDGVGLFAICPGQIPTVTRLSRRGSNEIFGDNMYSFEPSPDGHFAAVSTSSGSVDVLDLYTGNVQMLQTDNLESPKGLYLMPQWKNSDQLTFAAHVSGKEKSKHSADIVFWSMNKQNGEVLSKDWPKTAIKDFLQ